MRMEKCPCNPLQAHICNYEETKSLRDLSELVVNTTTQQAGAFVMVPLDHFTNLATFLRETA